MSEPLPFVDFSDEVPVDYANVIKTTKIVVEGITFVFDEIPALRTDLESYAPKDIDDLSSIAHWLSELKMLWPREARLNNNALQGDLKSLWMNKLNSWEEKLAEKVEQLLS